MGAVLAFTIIVLRVLLTPTALVLTALPLSALVPGILVLARHRAPLTNDGYIQEIKGVRVARLSEVGSSGVKDYLRPGSASSAHETSELE